jgi:hypothetical protein
MTQSSCASPIPLATLLEYWLGELDASAGRPTRSAPARLQPLQRKSAEPGRHCRRSPRGVRTGAVNGVVTGAFVKRLAAEGLRLREYRVPQNGSIHCTVTPDDDLLITRLDAPLVGVERLDLERLSGEGTTLERMCDVPFDVTAGEVVLTPRMERIRALPATTVRFRLLAVAPSGERLVGEYTLHHTPYRPATIAEPVLTLRRAATSRRCTTAMQVHSSLRPLARSVC